MKTPLFLFLIFLTTHSFAQEEFDRFWNKFKKDITAKDKDALLDHCQFPLSGNVDDEDSEEGYYEGEFLNDFEEYFDSIALDQIANSNPSDLAYQDISGMHIPNLTFGKGYVLMITYQHEKDETDSSVIFTFGYVNNKWKLVRIDQAG